MVNKPIIGVAAAIFVVAIGGVYYLKHRNVATPSVPAPSTSTAPGPSEPGIAHPLPEAGNSGTGAPLPDLAGSDVPLRDALAQLTGEDAVKSYLAPEDLIRRMVVTIDNLPRQKVAVDKRPTSPIGGSFGANGDELHATLDKQNFDRYKPMVAVVHKLDMQQLAAIYIRFYPLFQQSYQNLGYPTGYFNDRLVAVIDDMLATPEPKGPVELVRPNVMYTFADPALEARSAGQKLLIRMGPENEETIKAKLRELRAAIATGSLKRP
ncbi:MAG TPA: DUF3014 domain-containing protein [Steroidobacteraceae bacterium]